MLSNLIKRFTAPPSPEPLADDDARLALAALMVRVARVDGQFDASEEQMITSVLKTRYNLENATADALLNEAKELETHAPDNVRFTRLIKEAVPYEERSAVAVALWKVVLADQKRDAMEDSLLRLVVHLIGVNDRDSAFARQQAQAEMEDNQ